MNLIKFSQKILPNDYVVEKVKYFTARLDRTFNREAYDRQDAYFQALKTLPNIEIILGKHNLKNPKGRLVNLPIANENILITQENGIEVRNPYTIDLPEGDHLVHRRKILRVKTFESVETEPVERALNQALQVRISTMEEKRTDVNIACHILNDAWKKSFDAAAIISNDTDLFTPIKMVVEERKKDVYIIGDGEIAQDLKDATGNKTRYMRDGFFRESQFPLELGNGISCPNTWR